VPLAVVVLTSYSSHSCIGQISLHYFELVVVEVVPFEIILLHQTD